MSLTENGFIVPFSLTGLSNFNGTINGGNVVDSITVLGQTAYLTASSVDSNGNINLTLNIPNATSLVSGLLSSIDWNTFNNKQNTITATTPLNISSNIVSINQATTSQNGYLSSTDWNTFNDKAGLGLNNVFTNTNQFNSNFNIISPNIAFTNLGTTTETHFLAINNANGLITKNPISTLSILGSNNTWTGVNTFTNYVFFNSANTFGVFMPFSDKLRIGYDITVPAPPTNAYMDFDDTGGTSIWGVDLYIAPATLFDNNITIATNKYIKFNDIEKYNKIILYGNDDNSAYSFGIGYNTLLYSAGNGNAHFFFTGGKAYNPLNLYNNGGDFRQELRTGVHGTLRGLYVTGTWGQLQDGAEFRHSDGTKGVGIGYGGLYATGLDANHDLSFKSKGTGQMNFYNDTSLSLSIISSSFQIRTNASLITYLDADAHFWLEANGDVMSRLIRNGFSDFKWVVYRSPTSFAFYNTLSNTLGTVSDERTKKDIKPIDINKSKEFILSITPSTFRFIDGNTQVKNIGFIAQDILKNAKTEAQKNIVSNWKIYEEQNGDPYQEHKDASGNITMKKAYLGVSQMSILPEVCGCLQQMEKENQELKLKVLSLEERLLKIEKLIDLA